MALVERHPLKGHIAAGRRVGESPDATGLLRSTLHRAPSRLIAAGSPYRCCSQRPRAGPWCSHSPCRWRLARPALATRGPDLLHQALKSRRLVRLPRSDPGGRELPHRQRPGSASIRIRRASGPVRGLPGRREFRATRRPHARAVDVPQIPVDLALAVEVDAMRLGGALKGTVPVPSAGRVVDALPAVGAIGRVAAGRPRHQACGRSPRSSSTPAPAPRRR
jgi:hypothetical protein